MHTEAYDQLCQTLGPQLLTFHNLALIAGEYKSTEFAFGIDTEKVLEARFTWLTTRSSDLLTAKFKYAKASASGASNPIRVADLMRIVLQSYHILKIHDTSLKGA